MSTPKPHSQRLFSQSRIWHRRLAIWVALPLLLTLCTGLLLLLRADFAWIQPPALTGTQALTTPRVSHEALLARLRALPSSGVTDWQNISSVIFNPGKGIYQVRLRNDQEIQLDATTAEVLSQRYRTSNLLLRLHEGDFFVPWIMKRIFLLSGLGLLILWITGLYLLLFPKFNIRAPKPPLQEKAETRPSASV